MDIDEIKENSAIDVKNKPELFLRLCALNYLNALVKRGSFGDAINYGIIKPSVLFLIICLKCNEMDNLYEQLAYKPGEECVYIRCYGLQFAFHRVDQKTIENVAPEIVDYDVEWDGITLQNVSESLYELSKEVISCNLDGKAITDKINKILQNGINR